MTNLEKILRFYKLFLSCSKPNTFGLDLLYSDLKSAFADFVGVLVTDDEVIKDIVFRLEKPSPSVSLGAKREGRRI